MYKNLLRDQAIYSLSFDFLTDFSFFKLLSGLFEHMGTDLGKKQKIKPLKMQCLTFHEMYDVIIFSEAGLKVRFILGILLNDLKLSP